jgi:hypothetical protein
MNSKEYFYKCYENLVNPLCRKVLSILYLTQALSMCICVSLWFHLTSFVYWVFKHRHAYDNVVHACKKHVPIHSKSTLFGKFR